MDVGRDEKCRDEPEWNNRDEKGGTDQRQPLEHLTGLCWNSTSKVEGMRVKTENSGNVWTH